MLRPAAFSLRARHSRRTERVERMRDPAVKAAILSEQSTNMKQTSREVETTVADVNGATLTIADYGSYFLSLWTPWL